VAVVILGLLTVLLRGVIEPGFELGEEVAGANEHRQESAKEEPKASVISVFSVWRKRFIGIL